MDTPVLKVTTRDIKGRKTYHLREEGLIPAVVYGAGEEKSLSITLDRGSFARLYKSAGESTIVELQVEGGKSYNVLIQDYQIDPLRDEVTHADFRVVDMNKPIEAEVKLRFVGDAPAVKAMGGTLVTPLTTLKIKALPKNLVSFIEVDLGKLSTFDETIRVRDLVIPEGIEVKDKADRTIALVMPPLSDEELAKLDEKTTADVAAVEVVGEKKEGDEEAAAEEDGKGAPKEEGKKKDEQKK